MSEVKTSTFSRRSVDLYGRQSDPQSLGQMLGMYKSLEEAARSGQSAELGEKAHPFDFHKATQFQTLNVHHSTCIQALTNATVGGGFRQQDETEEDALKNMDKQTKAEKVLDPLCEVSVQDLLSDASQDYYGIGSAYIEVVRSGTPRTTSSSAGRSRTTGNEIVGLHHIPGHQPVLFLEDEDYNKHYIIKSCEGTQGDRRFALFGDREGFISRMATGSMSLAMQTSPIETDPEKVSEVIVLRKPSALSRWYGFPSWLAAVPSMDLVQYYHQWKYDFFLNRGVPEFLLFVTGGQVDDDQWEKIESAIKANIGLGNSQKSAAINIPGTEIAVQLEKLGLEGKGEDEFTRIKEILALDIVSAHQVPPLLAGIQIPGKLGSVNELPNALLAFNVLVVHPAQRNICTVLRNTLGNKTLNGGLDLVPDDFRLRRVIDTINFQNADTVSRMRTPAAAAAAEGRDINDGLRD